MCPENPVTFNGKMDCTNAHGGGGSLIITSVVPMTFSYFYPMWGENGDTGWGTLFVTYLNAHFIPGSGGGFWNFDALVAAALAGRTPQGIKQQFYAQHGQDFNNCIQQVFGADANQIPPQTIQNAPVLNATLPEWTLGGPDQCPVAGHLADGCNAPNSGPKGTVFVSSNMFWSNEPNVMNAIYGTYAHELGNILDANLNPPGTSGQPYERTYGNPQEPEGDPDTGAQVEICLFGTQQYPNQQP